LKEQAGGPIGNPKEMASNHDLAVKIISSIPAFLFYELLQTTKGLPRQILNTKGLYT
jgi:hypothetical protein